MRPRKKRKPNRSQTSSTMKTYPKQCFTKNKVFGYALFGGGEESRTPVRKYFLKDFSGRSHFIKIPAAARQMTGLQGW